MPAHDACCVRTGFGKGRTRPAAGAFACAGTAVVSGAAGACGGQLQYRAGGAVGGAAGRGGTGGGAGGGGGRATGGGGGRAPARGRCPPVFGAVTRRRSR